MADAEYKAGSCNIGRDEASLRRHFGWAMLAVSGALIFAMIRNGTNPLWRLTVFLPATLSATGFLQAHFHFCVLYARRGLFNFDFPGHAKKIEEDSSRAADRRRGDQLLGYAALIGAAVAVVAVFV